MSKRKHGVIWTRKASNLAAKEGWSERESNIKDFMNCSPDKIDSQYDLNIECASSDEEEKSRRSAKTAVVKKIYKIKSDQQIKKDNDICNFNDKLEDFGIQNKRRSSKRFKEQKISNLCLNKDIQVKDNCNKNAKYIKDDHKITLKKNVSKVIENPKNEDASVFEQVLSPQYNENSNTFDNVSKVKVRVDESDDEQEFEISPVFLTQNVTEKRVGKYQKKQKGTEQNIIFDHSSTSSVISEIKTPVFSDQRYLRKTSPSSISPKKSPVLSSRRKCVQKMLNTVQCQWSPVFKSKKKNTFKSPETGTQNISQLESPVLRSKSYKQPDSPVLSSRRVLKRKLTFGYYSVSNKSLVRDIPVQPYSEPSTRNTFCETRNMTENDFTPISGKGNSVIRMKQKRRNLAQAFTEYKKDNFEGTVEIKIDPSESKYNSEVEDHNDTVNLNLKINTNVSQDCSDQSTMVIEDVNDAREVQLESQESEPIEECITPSNEVEGSSQNIHRHNKFLFKSMNKCSKNAFFVQEENVGCYKGSKWIQTLNQKTPDRPCKDKQTADRDSSKKNMRIKNKQWDLAHKKNNFEGPVEMKEGQSESRNVNTRREFEKVYSFFEVEHHNNKVNVNTNVSFLKSSQDCSEQSTIAIEDVNDTKQVQLVSQESEPIEECMTPSKDSSLYNIHHHTEYLAKSVNKCNKNTISVQEENEGCQKGSEWLRALNQKTPDRPSKDNEHTADPDSSKKKILKDGLAARLRRLLPSWQSSVQMWKHQISITGEQNRQKTTSSCNSTPQTPNLPQHSQSSDLSCDSEISDRRQIKEKLRMAVKSPALRNLQCALLVSPKSSRKRQATTIEPPKKQLLLKIVKIGGRLPAGGTLCEKIDIVDTINSNKVPTDVEAIHNKRHDNSLHTYEQNKNKKSERLIVIFATQEQNDALSFQVNDQVIIYSPWKHLDLPGHNVPTLFSSYFTIQPRTCQINEGKIKVSQGDWSKSPLKRKISKRKVILTSWSCSCSTNSAILPTICEGRNFHLKNKIDMFNLSVNDQQRKLENVCGIFKVIQDNSEGLPIQNSARPQSWSIVEAIEICGGLSDIPVTVILYVYRIIKIKDLIDKNDYWLLIGADIMGVFCTVTVPDRPLAKHLSPLLNEGEGTIRTFTQLTVTQRHTDNKSPGLFSLLHTFHHAYQKAIKENENLMTLNIHKDSKAPASFCYNFTVTLGSTTSQLVTGIPNVPISLPLWSVSEALKVSGVAQRGSIFFHVIYKVEAYLYVICPDEYPITLDQSLFLGTSKGESRVNITNTIESSGTDDTICKERTLSMSNGASWVTRVSVQEGSTLPTWLAKNGTIMQGAIVRDVISYKGSLMVDELSEIKMKKSEVNLTLGKLYHILPKLQCDSNFHQLVHVSGNICYVDEENAFSWPICEHCTSEKLQETQAQCDGVNCLNCGKISVSPDTGYSLEVYLDCMELPNNSVKIKLYQRTIKKLISACLGSEGEAYDATNMIGRVVGPLVCFIEEVKSRTNTNPRTFILLQLPY